MLKTRVTTTLLLLAVATACGGGDDGGTNPPVTVGGFTVSLSSTTLSIQQGASGSVTATIARTGSFTGTVNLSTESVPAGITAAFNPSAVTSSTTSTALTVDVAASVAPGNYTFTIRGQAAGVTEQRTATVSMTVTARPSIALALSPTSASVAQGGSTSFTATVTPTNFTGATSVAITGAPAGVAPTVTTSGNTHTVAVAVGAATAPGTYTLTATASGSGVTSVSATFALTVTTAPASAIGLAAAPAALTVQAGGASATTTLAITRTNFTGNVTLGAQSGLPAGATVTFNPGPTTGDATSVATFTAGAATAAGTYSVVLQATGTGAATGTVTIALTVTAAPTGSIAIAATPNALNATAGGAGVTSTIAITRTNYTGDVTFSVTGMPAGSQNGFNPSPATGNSTTMTLTFGGTVAAGTYPINVTASGTNIAPVTIQVMVTVAPAAASSIALSVSQNPVTVQQGTSGGNSIIIARTNFTGQVNLSVSGVPANVTATLGTPSTLTNGSTLTFAAASNATPGSYPITITGSGTNIPNATTTVTLTVTQPTSGGNVTARFCGTTPDEIPIWFAAQSGSGSWTRITAGPNNTYSFTIGSTGGVAYVTQETTNEFDLTIVYGTAAELAFAEDCNPNTPPPGTKTVTGSVSGFGGTNSDQVAVQFGGRLATPAPTFAAPNFTITQVPDGARDLLATRTAATFVGGNFSFNLNKVFIRRGLNPSNNSSVGVVDFGGSDAFDPDRKTLTMTGVLAGEQTLAGAVFTTANGSSTALDFQLPGTATTFQYAAVPSARTVAGDLHLITAIAATLSGQNTVATRSVTSVARDAGNLTANFGAPLGVPTLSSSNGGYARVRSVVARSSDYPSFWLASFEQSGTSADRRMSISMSQAYLGGATNFDVQVPDFTGVAGWLDTWGPRVGVAGEWALSASGWVIGNGQLIEGSLIRTGSRFAPFTP